MQKTDARIELCGAPPASAPAGAPVSAIRCAPVWPNAPGLICPWQKWPEPSDSAAVPMVSGVRLTGSGAWKPARFGGQSTLVPLLPVALHELPAFLPYVHEPLRHFGHGEAALP